MKRIWLFLGSARLAALLIACAIIGVIAGTFIEAQTESHAAAASWIYGNRWFQILLSLFFVNILVSSLHRWPFRWKHLPFLMTHLGLLMIITGTLVKSVWGTQGSITLMEGGITHHIDLPATMALHIRKKDGSQEVILLKTTERNLRGQRPITIKAFHPHALELYHSWIVHDHLQIEGLEPLPAPRWQKGYPLPSGTFVKLEKKLDRRWRLIALRTDDVELAAQTLYGSDKIQCSTLEGASLKTTPQYGQVPTIAWLQDLQGDLVILVIFEDGTLASEIFLKGAFPTVLAYDEGFDGYASLIHLPIDDGITLTSPLTIEHRMAPSRLKIEENKPRLVFELDGKDLSVVYHQRNPPLPMPTADGQYLVSLTSQKAEIPYNLRLHKASQVNYPGTRQPSHYEARVTLEERATGTKTKAILSMNEVLETPDGYRFYLSGMTPEEETAPKQVHLVVNRDPAKYLITYPGGIIAVLGIVMLLSVQSATAFSTQRHREHRGTQREE